MKYRISNGNDKISTIGIGSTHMHEISREGIFEIIEYARKEGINLIDLAMSYPEPMDTIGEALENCRSEFFIQMHLGMTFPNGQYVRTRDLEAVKSAFEEQLQQLRTTYADFVFIHCVDEQEDFEEILTSGVLEYAQELKKQGKVKYIGFASHTISICHQFLELGIFDTCMFSVNAAYDLDPVANVPFEELDMRGQDQETVAKERLRFYQACQKRNVDIQVMKAYGGGLLLDANRSPFGQAMTIPQCLQYALDRPAVLSIPVGVRKKQDLEEALQYYRSSEQERDYAFIATLQHRDMKGTCVYCNHCLPCPKGIDIGAVHKYLDLYLAGDMLAKEHYLSLTKRAKDCIYCGACEKNCPFSVDVRSKMKQAVACLEK